MKRIWILIVKLVKKTGRSFLNLLFNVWALLVTVAKKIGRSSIMKTLKLIVWVILSLSSGGIGVWLLVSQSFILGGFFILAGFWTLMSIKIVGPDEMAVLVWLGEPIGFRDSGPHFVLRFFGKLVRYPQKAYNFDYETREVVSQSGEYSEGEDKDFYGTQVLKVDAVVYLNFPRELRKKNDGEMVDDEETHPLIKILRNQVPIREEELKNWTEDALLGALRVAFGQMTWKEAVQNIDHVNREVEKVFTESDGALIRVGFSKKGIKLVVAEIHLPPELEKSLPLVDKQRLEAKAAPFEAEQIAIETVGSVIRMMAQSRGKEIDEIQAQIDADPDLQKEFLEKAHDLVIRRMGIDGKSYTDIRVQGAEGIERTILNALAVWKGMSPMGGKEKEQPERKKRTSAETKKSIEQTKKEVEKLKKETKKGA